jgi:phage FluMu protein Com
MLKLRCTSCSKALGVKDSLAGKQIKCPGCGTINTVPQPELELDPEPAESPPGPSAPTIRVAAPKKAAAKPTGSRAGASSARRKKKKRANPGLLLLCGSLLALAAVGVAAFVLLGGKPEVQIASQAEPDQQDALTASDSAPVESADDTTGPPQDADADPVVPGGAAAEETEWIEELPELGAGHASDETPVPEGLAGVPLNRTTAGRTSTGAPRRTSRRPAPSGRRRRTSRTRWSANCRKWNSTPRSRR